MAGKHDDILGTGLAGYAMMLSLLSTMVKAGRGEEAMAILEGAHAWLSREGIAKASRVIEARGRIEAVKNNLGLLTMKTDGLVQ